MYAKTDVYVPRCFQKKNVKGIKTIKARLKLAMQIDAEMDNEEEDR